MRKKHHSTAKIQDDIAALNVSRQRKYQLRKRREGRCIICGELAYKGTLFCLECNRKRGIRNPGKNRPRRTL